MEIRPFKDCRQGAISLKAEIRRLVKKARYAKWFGDDRTAELNREKAKEKCIDLKAKIAATKRLNGDPDGNDI